MRTTTVADPTPTPDPTSTPQAKTRKASTVRHTRAIQRDRQTRPTVAPSALPVEERVAELLHPATLAQVASFRALGLRERVLTLPVMVAFVLSLIWRQLGSVAEAVRVLRSEGLLWTDPLTMSQQAVSARLRCFPPALFAQVLTDVLPQMHARWQQRGRPLPPALAWARAHFTAVLILDGATLDSLLHKVGLLREHQGPLLAGRIAALLDLLSELPRQVWYLPEPQAHDQRFWDNAVAVVPAGALLLFDLGFLNHEHFDDLTTRDIGFLTRAGAKMVYHVEEVLRATPLHRDRLVVVGSPDRRCRHRLRLIEHWHRGCWYRYLTNVLEPARLPSAMAVALYWQRWRVEDAFLAVKRLLGLAYFWTGAVNGILTQVWATWLLYSVLVDLTDAVAETLVRPFQDLSLEMVYRGLYHFTQAYHRGEATDPVAYLAANAQWLGLLTRRRRTSPAALLALTFAEGP